MARKRASTDIVLPSRFQVDSALGNFVDRVAFCAVPSLFVIIGLMSCRHVAAEERCQSFESEDVVLYFQEPGHEQFFREYFEKPVTLVQRIELHIVGEKFFDELFLFFVFHFSFNDFGKDSLLARLEYFQELFLRIPVECVVTDAAGYFSHCICLRELGNRKSRADHAR